MSSNKKRTLRRGFLKGVAISTATVTNAEILKQEKVVEASSQELYPAKTNPKQEFDFTQQSGALQPDRIVDSACQFCNSLCRLKVHIKDERIIDVVGEPDDPVQAGGFCAKGPMMTQLV